jgi:large subunit ribosomal protein L15
MKLNNIRDNVGATHSSKVVGRGIGSGLGKTSGKGQKGQKSRGSGKVRLGFEGGQNPIYRRLPKRGFTNIFKKNFFVLNLSVVSELLKVGKLSVNDVITYEFLKSNGIIRGNYDGIRVLAKGELEHPVKFKVHGISEKALESVNAKGGDVEIIKMAQFVNKPKSF